MYFALSKILWAVVSPLNFIFLLLLAGAGASVFCRKAARFLIASAIVLFFIAGITPLGPNLLASLENRYERPEKLLERITGIVILGGTFDGELSAARNALAVNDSMERVIEGLRLARQHPLAMTVFSGGEGHLLKQGRPEAREVMRWMSETGYHTDDFLFEEKSRNTQENIQFTKDMVNPGPREVWVVVTSAFHMPRTMELFRKLDWPGTVIPWPVDYRTDGKIRLLPQRFDVAGNVYKTDLALHEWAGMAAGRF